MVVAQATAEDVGVIEDCSLMVENTQGKVVELALLT